MVRHGILLHIPHIPSVGHVVIVLKPVEKSTMVCCHILE